MLPLVVLASEFQQVALNILAIRSGFAQRVRQIVQHLQLLYIGCIALPKGPSMASRAVGESNCRACFVA